MPNPRSGNNRRRRKQTTSVDLVPVSRPTTGFQQPFSVVATSATPANITVVLPGTSLAYRVRSILVDLVSATPSTVFIVMLGGPAGTTSILRTRDMSTSADIRTANIRSGRFLDRSATTVGGTVTVATATLSTPATVDVLLTGTVFGSYVL